MNEITSKPTPGPWEVYEFPPGSYAIEPDIAWLSASSSQLPGENLANAQLIQQAPEMLAALHVIATIASPPHHDRALQGIMEIAMTEIAKTKGETPS